MDYQKIYNQLIERARLRTSSGYVERHHILPRCMGGADFEENLVSLYPEEHFVAHALLLKIYKGTQHRHALAKAVHIMARGHYGKRVTRKLYGWLQREHALAMSKHQQGSSNSQYGSRWICHLELMENRKIGRNEEIPEGWIQGRNKWKGSRCRICSSPISKPSVKRCRKCDNNDRWRPSWSKQIRFNGRVYPSQRSLASELGVCIGTVQYWVKTGKVEII